MPQDCITSAIIGNTPIKFTTLERCCDEMMFLDPESLAGYKF